MRAAKFLTPTTGDAIPRQLIVVGNLFREDRPGDCALEGEGRLTPYRQLLALSASYHRLKGCEVDTVNDCPPLGKSADFWDWVKARLYPKTQTWLITLDAYELVTDTGLWQLLEAGEWVTSGGEGEPDGESEPTLDECRAVCCQGNPGITPGRNPGSHRKWTGFVCCENPPTIIQCRPAQTTGTLKIVDGRNYGLADWRELSAYLPGHLIDTLMSRQGTSPSYTASVRQLALREWFLHFLWVLKSNGLGGLQNTAAAQAYYSFRRKYLDKDVIHIHANQSVCELERRATFGGRCEVRHLGKHRDVYELDIRSMYPALAAADSFPVALKQWGEEATPQSLANTLCQYRAIARVKIKTNTPQFPVRWSRKRGLLDEPERLPMSDLASGKSGITIWPTGMFTTWLAGLELERASAAHQILEVYEWAAYECGYIFDDYVEDLWRLRSEYLEHQDESGARVVKALLNSFLGRWAQWSKRWIPADGPPDTLPFDSWWGRHPETMAITQWRSIAGEVAYRDVAGETATSFPAIVAFLTAAGRQFLWDLIGSISPEHCLYYDTDSIWITEHGLAQLRDWEANIGEGLGDIRIVRKHREVEFRGLRHYVCDGILTASGVPGSGEIPDCSTRTWTASEPMSKALGAERPPTNTLDEKTWRASGVYKHGRVLESGRVIPFRFGPLSPVEEQLGQVSLLDDGVDGWTGADCPLL